MCWRAAQPSRYSRCCVPLVCSEEAGRDRGVAGGGQLHLPRHPVQAALPAGEGVGRRTAPHRRGKGEDTHRNTHLINNSDEVSVKVKAPPPLSACSSESSSSLLQDEEHHEQTTDVRSQLRFFEQLERMEKQRKDEQEREILLKAAKVQNSSSCFKFD